MSCYLPVPLRFLPGYPFPGTKRPAARTHQAHSLLLQDPPGDGPHGLRKAGEYFKIKVHLVACPAPTYQVDVRRVARLINANTVLLVGSAPNFPHGIMDDISALSKLALRRRLPLHVDCCLGSFLVPFLDKAGFETAPFDFGCAA